MLSRSLAFAIAGYQRHLSPYKGFCCAHRVRHGGVSCSEYVKQAVLAEGLWRALPDIRRRFAECKAAALAVRVDNEDKRRKRKQREKQNARDCDVDFCDCCELAGLIPDHCSLLEGAGAGLEACSCWP